MAGAAEWPDSDFDTESATSVDHCDVLNDLPEPRVADEVYSGFPDPEDAIPL